MRYLIPKRNNMPRRTICQLLTLLILYFIFCARDHEDILALKNYLSSKEHEQYLSNVVNNLDFFKFGYDNIIAPNQLDSLRKVNQTYLAYLIKYKPEYELPRKIQQNFIEIAQSYQNEFDQIPRRIEAFRKLSATIDSLEALSEKSKLIELTNKRKILRESITNKFLIKRTQIFINDITNQFFKLNEQL